MADQSRIEWASSPGEPVPSPADDNGTTPESPRTDNGYSYGSFPVYTSGSGSGQDGDGLPKPTAASKSPTRALAPDLTRGLLMAIMAMDHLSMMTHTWQHGLGRDSEQDGKVVREFNFPAAYIVRAMTHFCAPGFVLLLGMGVVYLGNSRSRLGWSSWRLLRYFAVRGAVLTLVGTVFGVVLTGGEYLFMNVVIFALAVDYFLAGVLWLLMNKTESMLSNALHRFYRSDEAEDQVERPLLGSPTLVPSGDADPALVSATNASWHIHNAALFMFSVVSIWWNIWLSPTHGHCHFDSSDISATASQGDGMATVGEALAWLWFYPVVAPRMLSMFPPMAWVSFAILGLLYGRLVVARKWSAKSLALWHALAGVLFLLFFALTRVFRFGNLSEGCLHTPLHDKHPGMNPYLLSGWSFFYTIKYPPDVAFWSFSLAGIFLMLAMFNALPLPIARRLTILLDFGTAALFYYVVHMLVAVLIGLSFTTLLGEEVEGLEPIIGNTKAIRSVPAFFGLWAVVMLIMWPLCRWYSRFKSTKPADSLWRLF